MKDITIAFSGGNIKDYAILAIQSFLKFYPYMKDNIVWFDDYSTDGTLEWMYKNGIRVITWKYHKDDIIVANYNSRYNNLAMKCNYIIREILLQCDTRYIMVNDGDVYFTRGGFLEEYFARVNDWKAIFLVEKYLTTLFDSNIPQSLMKYGINLERHNDGRFCLPRAWTYHGIMDLSYLMSKGIIFDNIDNEEYNVMLGIKLECGHDYYYQIKSRGIPHLSYDMHQVDYIHHIGWIGSYSAYIRMTSGSMGDINVEMSSRIRRCLDHPVVKEICAEHGLRLLSILR